MVAETTQVGCNSNVARWHCNHIGKRLRLRHDEPLVRDPTNYTLDPPKG